MEELVESYFCQRNMPRKLVAATHNASPTPSVRIISLIPIHKRLASSLEGLGVSIVGHASVADRDINIAICFEQHDH